MFKLRLASILAASTVLLAACATPSATPSAATPAPETLTVMTHDSFSATDTVIAAFESAYNAKVAFVKAGDAGTALNKAILSKDKPLADVFYGVDNTFLTRALTEGIYEPYASPALANIPDAFKLDPENRALPVDYGDVCLNYDRAYFTQHKLSPPQSLEDLLKPEYKDLLVVEDAGASSPGLAFLLTTVGHFGPNGYLDYWKGLVQNGVLVVNDWETAYNTQFSGSSGRGPRPIVVSYNSSPAFEVVNAPTPPAEPPTVAVVADDTCFRQIEFVGILKGTSHRALAQAWVDFMLSKTFQEDMPLQMYVFPVNSKASVGDAFSRLMAIPTKTANVPADQIAANRDNWIKAWREVVLH